MEKPKNKCRLVELKARVDNLGPLSDKLIQDGAEQVGIFHQVDTYYEIPRGRLKLREIEGQVTAELIYYERENIPDPKQSEVFLFSIPKPKIFKEILRQIIKIKAVVDKGREIYFYKGVKIHLDSVKGLGYFIEFERITSEDSERQREDTQKILELRDKLGINPQSQVRLSYSDLI